MIIITGFHCSCCRSGKIALAQLHDPPQEFKKLLEDSLFLVKVRSYNNIFAFTSMGESLVLKFSD